MSTIFRERFQAAYLASRNLSAYLDTNRQHLVSYDWCEMHAKAGGLTEDVETPMRALRDRGFDPEQKAIYKLFRKNWKCYRDQVSAALDLKECLTYLKDPLSDKYQVAVKVSRKAFLVLKRHVKEVCPNKLPQDLSTPQQKEQFVAIMKCVSKYSFDTKEREEAFYKPTLEFKDFLSATAPKAIKPVLPPFTVTISDLTDALYFSLAQREEMKRLARTFCMQNPEFLSEVEMAMSKLPQEMLDDFSPEVFSHMRLLMICLINSAKTGTETFQKHFSADEKKKFDELIVGIRHLSNPLKLFLEDELDESLVMILFTLVQKIKFLNSEYKFDNPNQEDVEKETAIFSAYIQLVLKEKYFPKQAQINRMTSALDTVFEKKAREDSNWAYGVILNLFVKEEYELGISYLVKLSKLTKNSEYFNEVLWVFLSTHQYGRIKALLLKIDSLPYDEKFLKPFLTRVLSICDLDFAAHIIILMIKSKKAREVIITNIRAFLCANSFLDDWLSITTQLHQKKQTLFATTILMAIAMYTKNIIYQNELVQKALEFGGKILWDKIVQSNLQTLEGETAPSRVQLRNVLLSINTNLLQTANAS